MQIVQVLTAGVIILTCAVQAANAGGVAVSALEMAQNSARLTWSSAEVDDKLKVDLTACIILALLPVSKT